jgi:thiosulfate dehydrogenase [quinone] large subunit
LFLAAGWLRAALVHLFDGAWWSGQVVRQFVAFDTSAAIGVYRPFLEYVVAPLPTVTALIVVTGQLVAGGFLLLNYKPMWGVLLGAFLNLQFILAGAVNPSAFYLVMALVVVLWRMERSSSLSTSRRLTRAVGIFAGLTTVVMVPFIASLSPERAIDDPALVLIFISLLFATTTWWTSHRIASTDRLRLIGFE